MSNIILFSASALRSFYSYTHTIFQNLLHLSWSSHVSYHIDEEQSTALSDILDAWFIHLNDSHPKLYTKTSDSVEVERHFETEYERAIQAHEMDAERATASYADEGMVTTLMTVFW